MRGKKTKETPVASEKFLDVDASMQGTMIFKDPVNLRINGKFDGTLQIRGSLTIGESAEVTADIDGEFVTIAGTVRGTVNASKELILVSPALMEGDITTPSLQVESGALLNGQCIMTKPEQSTTKSTVSTSCMTVDELARYLEVDNDSITQWAGSGKIPAIREGNTWKFEREAIDDWVTAQRR